MSQLEKLYQSVQNLKELGIELPEKLIADTNRLEEEIIKKDIIPALAETISPIINQIQRELILVVEYIPNEPVSVRWSRKRSLSIPEVSEFDNLIQKSLFSERETFTIQPHSKSAKTSLKVSFPDGKSITHRFASETLVHTIRLIGYEKVKHIGMLCCGIPLISTTKDDFYTQHELSSGIYIMTHSSTKLKKEQLLEISKKLSLGLKVEII